jgi:hypothetical protein
MTSKAEAKAFEQKRRQEITDHVKHGKEPSITLGQSAMRRFATTLKPGGDRAKLKHDLGYTRPYRSDRHRVWHRRPAYRHPRRNMPHDALRNGFMRDRTSRQMPEPLSSRSTATLRLHLGGACQAGRRPAAPCRPACLTGIERGAGDRQVGVPPSADCIIIAHFLPPIWSRREH